MPKRLPNISPELMPYELTQQEIEQIPEQLLTVPEFVQTWTLWVEYRKSILHKPMTNYGARLSLNKLVKYIKQADPVQVINKSLENNWQGLFAENIFSYNQNGQEQKSKTGLVL
jgi:hypothetical protein